MATETTPPDADDDAQQPSGITPERMHRFVGDDDEADAWAKAFTDAGSEDAPAVTPAPEQPTQ